MLKACRFIPKIRRMTGKNKDSKESYLRICDYRVPRNKILHPDLVPGTKMTTNYPFLEVIDSERLVFLLRGIFPGVKM